MVGLLAAAGSAAEEGAHDVAHAAAASGVVRYAWIVALLPLIAAALTLFFGKKVPGKGPIFGIAALTAGLALSLAILWNFVQGGGEYTSSIDWFTVGPMHFQLGQFVDGLTAVMLVVVTSISLCVHVYSLGYMHGDSRFTWFYFVLSLFTAAMLNVLIADNLFQLLIGWEVMGVCSYLLIGHWWEDHKNSSAAIKAFITTRIGDIPFMFGIIVLVAATGFSTSNIAEIGDLIADNHVSVLAVSMAAILLFGGTIGKSAQFPLHVWLPDAMAGPTPVSALIHAATMVAAGVYLVGRLIQVFIHADAWVLNTVAIVAAITMLGAALLAVVQDDIKKVLAYSTISQLSFMVAGLSMGEAGYTAGFFHLFTHAFFKAALFLGAGAVIHAVHTNNMSEMGGLRKKLPITFWTFLIAAAALAGVPGLAGFWSKDELLVVAMDEGKTWLFIVLALTAVLTAFYMTRAVLMTFFGSYRGHAHPHENPPSMTGVLIALAGASVVVGWIGAPLVNGGVFSDWVMAGEHPHEGHIVPWIVGVSILAAGIGIGGGFMLYRRWREKDPVLNMGLATKVLVNKYYMDSFYMKGIVLPVRDKLSAFVYWTNQNILDRLVNGGAMLARGLGVVANGFDRRVIDGLVNGSAGVAQASGGWLKFLQSGQVQRYAVGVFVGVVVLTILIIKI